MAELPEAVGNHIALEGHYRIQALMEIQQVWGQVQEAMLEHMRLACNIPEWGKEQPRVRHVPTVEAQTLTPSKPNHSKSKP